MPPLPIEKDRQAFVKKLKRSGAFRDAVKHRMSEGQHPGMSEEEVVDMLFDKLMTFDSELSEAAPNAKAN